MTEPALSSGAALFAVDRDSCIVCWNEELETITRIRAEHALGRPCWEVVAAEDDRGSLVCHRGCARVSLALECRDLRPRELQIRTADGRRRVAMYTIAARAGDDSRVIHLLRELPEEAPAPAEWADVGAPPRLTPRQFEVLRLLAEGIGAREIAIRLQLSEATVRNHIRAVLLELGAHSQLEALFRARCHGLL